MEAKKEFIERYSKLTNFEEFMNINQEYLRSSVRVNTLKISIQEFKKKFPHLEQVPWCKEGFYIKGYGIGNTPEHFLGYFYVQEAASMIPPVVLDPQPGEMILDMAAAPGSKTTQMAAMMENTGLIIANESELSRLTPLSTNLERCGASNTLVVRYKGEHMKGLQFDKILLDAPCSGIGTIRKSPGTLQIYNVNMIKKLANVQRKLITNAWSLLQPGGTLVYSTCTLEPEENEGIISYALTNLPGARIEPIKLTIKRSPAIQEFEGTIYHQDVKHCLRIWPQDNNSEGFFVAKLRKE